MTKTGAVLAVLALSLPSLAVAPVSETVRLPHHLPQGFSQAFDQGRMAPTDRLSFAVSLKLRDPAGLADFLARVYNPADPLYGQYLTPEEFAERFAPTEEDYSEVVNYLASQGLRVVGTHPNRLLIDVEGAVSDVENAFQLEMHRYQTVRGKAAHAPNADPLFPQEIAGKLIGIVGLDNFVTRVAHRRRFQPSATANQVGTGPGGALSPANIRNIYNVSGTGSGQTLALFELDGYTASDIDEYESYFGITTPPTLDTVLVGSATGTPGSGADEVTLDIDMMLAIAPGASKIMVYEGPNTDAGVLDTYAKIADDNAALQISTSWGEAENEASGVYLDSEQTSFEQMATQGQSIYAAAGDEGAYDNGTTLSVDDPGSQLYVVSVGGTQVSVTASGGWSSETTWNGGSVSNGAGGGGISAVWSLPSWQANLATSSNGGSNTMRMVPDVSLDADPNSGYAIYLNGSWQIYGGTSAAAPLWAAFTAIVNEGRAENSMSNLGFPDPTLYALAESPDYSQDFHDIADGSTNLYYKAVTGYDLATGWGSFNGANLLAALTASVTTAPSSLTLTPHNQVIALSWAASAGATGYVVERSTASSGPFSEVADVSTNSDQDTGLTNGTTYYYYVEALDAAGLSAASSTESAVPTLVVPQAPTNFHVTGVTQ